METKKLLVMNIHQSLAQVEEPVINNKMFLVKMLSTKLSALKWVSRLGCFNNRLMVAEKVRQVYHQAPLVYPYNNSSSPIYLAKHPASHLLPHTSTSYASKAVQMPKIHQLQVSTFHQKKLNPGTTLPILESQHQANLLWSGQQQLRTPCFRNIQNRLKEWTRKNIVYMFFFSVKPWFNN